MGFFDAVVGGRAVGVPGVIAMLWQAHQDHGTLDWDELFDPAIRLARNGFKVSPRLNGMIAPINALTQHHATQAYFYIESVEVAGRARAPAGGLSAHQSGLCEDPEADRHPGPAGFYEGEVAQAIVNDGHSPSKMPA